MSTRYKLPDSTLAYILKGLIPYTDPNLKLTFKPHLFFADLEKIHNKKAKVTRSAYYRAIKRGLIYIDNGNPRLSDKAIARLKVYEPKKLKNARLMVIFDIPENSRSDRDRLRALLRECRFRMVQKSVWMTEYDCLEYIKMELKEKNLDRYVAVYESRPVINSYESLQREEQLFH